MIKTERAALAVTWGLLGMALAGLGLGAAPAGAAPGAEWTVCPAGPPDCQYTSIQAAVDAARAGDTVKVASGVYDDLHTRPVPGGYPGPPASGVVTQVVYLSKTLTLRGGYTAPGFADPPDPEAHPSTLDAGGLGRGLLIVGYGDPVIEGLTITGGDARGLGGGSSQWSHTGGGVYVLSATATVKDSWVTGNTTNHEGGGLYLRNSDATLSGNRVYANHARGGGGGLFLYGSNARLYKNSVTSNGAYWGGGLCLGNSAALLDGNLISDNRAWGYTPFGGGIYMYGSVATLRENSVISNVVYFISRGIGHSPDGNRNLPAPPLLGWGGGLFLVDSNATLDNNLIVGNAVEGTGGDARGGGLFLASSDATLRGNLISGNTVDRGLGAEGGGLYFSGSDATLDGNTIYGNDADYGGGLNFSGSDVTLDGNTIRGNSAGYGGGLYLWRSDVGLQNDVIAGNQADSRGSGLYIRGKSLRMVHTTIARNTGGDGSGVYVTGDGYPPQPGNVILSNTILVSHGVGLMVTAGSTATLEATLWGNGTDWAGEGTIYTGTVNLWGAPAFRKPNAGNYHVGPGSAALDQGVDLGVLSDIDRQPRPYLAPDLGADEYWPPGVLSRLYLPFVLKDR